MNSEAELKMTIKKQTEAIKELEKRLAQSLRSGGQLAKKEYDVKLTFERLRYLLEYNPETGIFTWTDSASTPMLGYEANTMTGVVPNRPKRRVAGGLDEPTGRWMIMLDGVMYAAHKLAWFYQTGAYPTRVIKHLNKNKSYNSWKNLKMKIPEKNDIRRGRT